MTRKLTTGSESALARIVEQSLNEIYIFHVDTFKFLYVNESGRTNLQYSMAELREMTPLDIKPLFTETGFIELVAPLLEKAKPVPKVVFETEHQKKNGSTYPARIHLQLGEYQDERVFVAIILDITREKEEEKHRINLERQMLQSQKLESLGVLAGGIAHDFNNILVGILGNAGIALEKLSPESPAADYIRSVENSAQRAAELTMQMLAYSGKGQFQIQTFDLNKLVEEMAHLVKAAIGKKAIIKFNFDSSLLPITADMTQIRQIVMNFITNASDAIGNRSGIISVSTGMTEVDEEYLETTFISEDLAPGVYVYLEVSDTGSGMTAEIQSQIFDPFFTTKRTGRGLGLAATLGIVRGHKGALKVYSEVGKGTSFKVLIPASPLSLDAVETQKKVVAERWMGSGKVLVVDDDETVRVLMKNILAQSGFEVVMAEDGIEGVKLCEKLKGEIALVLMDLTMPHMGGYEAFSKMRAIDKDLKVIISSGYNDGDVTGQFSGKGLAGFIQKPFKPSQLLQKIREVLGE